MQVLNRQGTQRRLREIMRELGIKQVSGFHRDPYKLRLPDLFWLQRCVDCFTRDQQIISEVMTLSGRMIKLRGG